MRAFGAGPQNPPGYKHTIHNVKSQSTSYKVPSDADLKYQMPQKLHLNEKIQSWLQGKFPVDRDEVLDNTKVNKYSVYYFFGN